MKFISGFSDCKFINSSVPIFSEKLIAEIDIFESESHDLSCCIFGVSKILWFFKINDSFTNWELKSENNNSQYTFLYSNRTLQLMQPKEYVDTGIYQCVGYSDYNTSITGEIIVNVENQSPKDFQLIGSSHEKKIRYAINSDYIIFCLIKAYKKRNCTFTWNKLLNDHNQSIIEGDNLTIFRRVASLKQGLQGETTLNWKAVAKNYRIYNFTLHLKFFKENYEGSYSCRAKESSSRLDVLSTFYFELIRRSPIYLTLGIILGLVILIIIMYIFKYDVKIILKQIIRKFIKQKNTLGNYNFIFIYDFDNISELQMVFKVIKELESNGFSSYFYHRDQIYGKDTMEDISCHLRNSDLIVIWASPNIWQNSTCYICLQILIHNFNRIKRIYAMTTNKKVVLKHCSNKAILMDTKSCLSSNIFVWNSKINGKSEKTNYSDILLWHNFISWLISCLPLKSKTIKIET